MLEGLDDGGLRRLQRTHDDIPDMRGLLRGAAAFEPSRTGEGFSPSGTLSVKSSRQACSLSSAMASSHIWL